MGEIKFAFPQNITDEFPLPVFYFRAFLFFVTRT